jgi:ribonuclease BN (tRNA processing enzyme)
MIATFYGVRGSTPCGSNTVSRYGGNTSSIVVEIPRTPPLLLDLGTGVRTYGQSVDGPDPFRGVALVSHLHWDHVQGLPFFVPVLQPGSELEIVSAPPGCGMSLDEAFDVGLRPPFFPVSLADLAGRFTYREAADERFEVGEATVTVFPVPHVGPTVGFRVDWRGRSVGFIPDHQQPAHGSMTVPPAVLDALRGVDVLVHDAQYTPEEFASKSDWGHSTPAYAAEVAGQCGAGALVLFHHDPTHDDETIDGFVCDLRRRFGPDGTEVLAAYEGLTVQLAPRGADRWPAR